MVQEVLVTAESPDSPGSQVCLSLLELLHTRASPEAPAASTVEAQSAAWKAATGESGSLLIHPKMTG